jgi:hypothetical protein
MKDQNINDFLTKEEKEKMRARVEKSLEEIKQRYKNHTLADKTKTYEERQRDLERYTKL